MTSVASRADIPGGRLEEHGAGGRQAGELQVRVIWAAAALATLLSLITLVATGHLTGVFEYDDGVYFGSALRLAQGLLPYRDFVLIQPPGLPLLLAPVALLAPWLGTHGASEIARLIVPLVSGANVLLLGRLVRHRSPLVVAVACIGLAVYPDAVLASTTLLLEPFLNFFCLAAATLAFEGDQLTGSGLRWLGAGALLGLGGEIKVWAVLPLAVLLLVCLLWRRRNAWRLVVGALAGGLAPALPFLLLAGPSFLHQVVGDQLGRGGVTAVSAIERLEFITSVWPGLGVPAGHLYKLLAAAASLGVVLLAVGALAYVPRRLSALEGFAAGSLILVTAALMWPADFFYHYAAFAGPFLALVVALALGRLQLRWAAPVVAATAVGLGLLVVHALAIPVLLQRSADPSAVLAAAIPQGACVVSDDVEFTINADRFRASGPDCPDIVDALGLTINASGSPVPSSETAQRLAAPLWLRAFSHAQYLLLTPLSADRIPWTPALRRYVQRHFVAATGPTPALVLRRRR